jgi:hypothetical protein
MLEISATDSSRIAWFGSHTASASSVEYTMSGVQFGVRVTGTHIVRVYMSMGQNFFTVRRIRVSAPASTTEYMLTSTSSSFEWVTLATSLDTSAVYDITVTKRTEPTLRTIFTSFEPVIVHRLSISPRGTFSPIRPEDLFHPTGWIEIIGDSDACGFGVSGEMSSTSSVLSMDPEMENVELAWGSRVAELLGIHSTSVIAGSGKGIVQNATMCGDKTLPEIWSQSQYTSCEPPKAVLILAGGNDFYCSQWPDEHEFVDAFSELLTSIKLVRGHYIPIVVFQCTARCGSSISDPDDAVAACTILDRLTREAVAKTGGIANRIFHHTIDIELDRVSDFGIMMHWNASGQLKIAMEMARLIRMDSGGS